MRGVLSSARERAKVEKITGGEAYEIIGKIILLY